MRTIDSSVKTTLSYFRLLAIHSNTNLTNTHVKTLHFYNILMFTGAKMSFL